MIAIIICCASTQIAVAHLLISDGCAAFAVAFTIRSTQRHTHTQRDPCERNQILGESHARDIELFLFAFGQQQKYAHIWETVAGRDRVWEYTRAQHVTVQISML